METRLRTLTALGMTGKDTVKLAGLTLQDQCFVAVDRTKVQHLDRLAHLRVLGLDFP